MATPAQMDMRRERERDLVEATRALFDERGMLDAPIEEIAKAVGIARGLIYRQFSSKDELFVLTVTHYLAELDGVLEEAIDGASTPLERLERGLAAFAGFCARYPAFLDISLFLMQRPARDLQAKLSDSVWLRLGRSMALCIDRLVTVLRTGAADGTFDVDDPAYTASIIWTQILGAMHLARSRVGVVRSANGEPELFAIDPERVIRTCVTSAVASVSRS
jgi:AcrR family transcriptional regulator